MRREMLTQHAFPRNFSPRYQHLNEIIGNQMQCMLGDIKSQSVNCRSSTGAIEIKPFIMHACANIFTQYYCSRSFAANDTKFIEMIKNFDQIFWEVNQGYAADFLPFLLPFHSKNLKRMENCTHEIRKFILDNIIEDRCEHWVESGDGENDYVESLIGHVHQNLEPKMEWETALFALEDILGGHAATGNFLVKVFGFIGQRPEVQRCIQAEIDATLVKKRTGNANIIELTDRNQMPYTEAVVMEALRLIASPIVPHVASQDSTIGGYQIEKDSLIFLNNYGLNMSEELWEEPKAFKPERFVQNGHVIKPDHFLPFGAGRRSCMGYKMVQFLSFSVIANCMQHFDVRPPAGVEYKVTVGSLAVPEKSYEMVFTERNWGRQSKRSNSWFCIGKELRIESFMANHFDFSFFFFSFLFNLNWNCIHFLCETNTRCKYLFATLKLIYFSIYLIKEKKYEKSLRCSDWGERTHGSELNSPTVMTNF